MGFKIVPSQDNNGGCYSNANGYALQTSSLMGSLGRCASAIGPTTSKSMGSFTGSQSMGSTSKSRLNGVIYQPGRDDQTTTT